MENRRRREFQGLAGSFLRFSQRAAKFQQFGAQLVIVDEVIDMHQFQGLRIAIVRGGGDFPAPGLTGEIPRRSGKSSKNYSTGTARILLSA